MNAVERTNIVLVDTNVWLDTFFGWRSHASASCEFISTAVQAGYQLAYAVHALKDVFYMVEATMKAKAREEKGELSRADACIARDTAWSCVEKIRDVACAVGADEADVWLACKHRPLHDDLEDNLVLAAALRANAAFLVTNDDRLLRKATVQAHTSEDALAVLKMGSGQF